MKTCTSCLEVKPLSAFGHNGQVHYPKLRSYCKSCGSAAGTIRNRRRALQQAKRSLDEAPLPSDARPGCLLRRGVALVPDCEQERWTVGPVVRCSECGLDQHLEVCLECSEPAPPARPPTTQSKNMQPYFNITTGPLAGSVAQLSLDLNFPVSDKALSDPAYLADALRLAKHYACGQIDEAFREWSERHTTRSATE